MIGVQVYGIDVDEAKTKKWSKDCMISVDELFVTQLNRSSPDNMIDSTIRLVVLITIKVQGH